MDFNFKNKDIKIKMISQDEIKEDDRSILLHKGDYDIDSIPDINFLIKNILEILKYIDKYGNNDNAKKILNEKYANIIPFGMITLLLEDKNNENIKLILLMVKRLSQVKKKEISIKNAEEEMSEIINNKYIYSKFGSKKKFERFIRKGKKKKY